MKYFTRFDGKGSAHQKEKSTNVCMFFLPKFYQYSIKLGRVLILFVQVFGQLSSEVFCIPSTTDLSRTSFPVDAVMREIVSKSIFHLSSISRNSVSIILHKPQNWLSVVFTGTIFFCRVEFQLKHISRKMFFLLFCNMFEPIPEISIFLFFWESGS